MDGRSTGEGCRGSLSGMVCAGRAAQGESLLSQRLFRAGRKIIPAPCQHFMQIQDTVPKNVPTHVSKKATVCTFCGKKSVATDAALSYEPGVMDLLKGKLWCTVLMGLIC